MSSNLTFKNRLKLGNLKEKKVMEILNLSSIPCHRNNIINCYDIDLFLPQDKIYMDVKYIAAVDLNAERTVEMKSEDCLILDKKHFKTYLEKQKTTGIETWINFLVDFKQFNVKELRFISVNKILELIDKEKAVVKTIYKDKNSKEKKLVYNINRNHCMSMIEFCTYICNKRK